MNKIRYHNGLQDVPEAIGPYSQAAQAGNLVFLSGQVPLDPQSAALVAGGIEQQTTQVMKNLQNALKGLGLDFSCVVKTTIFLADLGDFQTVNSIYSDWMKESRPARATVEVARLPLDARVEIEMIALKSDGS